MANNNGHTAEYNLQQALGLFDQSYQALRASALASASQMKAEKHKIWSANSRLRTSKRKVEEELNMLQGDFDDLKSDNRILRQSLHKARKLNFGMKECLLSALPNSEKLEEEMDGLGLELEQGNSGKTERTETATNVSGSSSEDSDDESVQGPPKLVKHGELIQFQHLKRVPAPVKLSKTFGEDDAVLVAEHRRDMKRPALLLGLNATIDDVNKGLKALGCTEEDDANGNRKLYMSTFDALQDGWTKHMGPILLNIAETGAERCRVIRMELLMEVYLQVALYEQYNWDGQSVLMLRSGEKTYFEDNAVSHKLPITFEACKKEYAKRFTHEHNERIAKGEFQGHQLPVEYNPKFPW